MTASEQARDFLVRKGVRVAAVVDPCFGDNGKGKFVDLFGDWEDVTVRGTGGANAGHTIVVGNETHVYHLLPSSISRDADGKISVIGRGTVVNPASLTAELSQLDAAKLSSNGLRVSKDAQLVLPTHLILDHLQEACAGKGKIGTTKQGIGPAYSGHRARAGVRVNDLLNRDALAKSVQRSLEEIVPRFKGAPEEAVHEAFSAVKGSRFYHPRDIFDADEIIDWLLKESDRFRDHIIDTDELVRSSLNAGKRVLLEGAQGVMLSVDYGTYPFVTSSDPSLLGLSAGAGLRTENVDYALSIVKAYATRVGEGPFPTKLADETGDNIRKIAGEFGATTGRPRDVGWIDLPLLRYAARYASDRIALTKPDILSEIDSVQVCTEYVYEGPDYREGEKTLRKGDRLRIACPDPNILAHCRPEYRTVKSWGQVDGSMSKTTLPEELKKFIGLIERELDSSVDMLSFGPDREQTLIF